MKCPLLTDKNYGEQLEQTMRKGDCIQEECAWWDDLPQRCSILSIAAKLTSIEGNIREGKK